LFTPLIKKAAELTGVLLKKEEEKESHTKSAASLRVIADHARAAAFLISDWAYPSNEGRGYVVRKIIRRAIVHGRMLGQTKHFLGDMTLAVCELMQDAYPELKESAWRVETIVLSEETRFARTLNEGLTRLEDGIMAVAMNAPGVLAPKDGQWSLDILRVLKNQGVTLTYPGKEAFKLYDTYGVPRDFIEDFCRDQGVIFDQAGFDSAMEEQKVRARASWKGAAKQTANPVYQQLPKSAFEGYSQTESKNCVVLAILKNGKSVPRLDANEMGEIILDRTPFYAESGGQVGDTGRLYRDSEQVAWVTGCYFPVQGVRSHKVGALQELRVDDHLEAKIDTGFRQSTMRNHTATHLLHAGLREVLGKHVKQAGSLVAPNHLRFDFSHFTAVEDEELQDIEDLINKEVLRNRKVDVIENVPIDVAVNEYHAMALFGEKYGDKVRVIKIGDFSTELCGGTHTGQTGEIGLIKILKEGSVSSGVRRVEAVTGEGSLEHFRKDHQLENVVSSFVSPTTHFSRHERARNGAPAAEEGSASLADALKLELEKKDAEIKRLTRELDQARMKSASSSTANIGEKVKEVKGVKVLAHRVDNLERPQMRTLVDQLREKLGSGVVVLGSASNGNVALIVGVTKDLIGRVQAGKVIGPVAQKVGGKGGGRPDLAEAGGKDASALDAALNGAYGVVEELLA